MIDKKSIPSEIPFFVSSRTVRMLGRENVSSSIVALTELIKNAYDADAEEVIVNLKKASKKDGEIIIEDTGDGMNFSELRDNWMVIGTNVKEREPTTKKGRVKVGKKGIGRLSLERLSDEVVIETFKENISYGLRLIIDWTKYNDPKVPFHIVKHPLETIMTRKKKGTNLFISKLRDSWTINDYEKLKRDLTLLIPPFDPSLQDFKIDLRIDEAPDLSGHIESLLGAIAEYKLESTLSKNGKIHHVLTHRDGTVKKDERYWHEAFNDADSKYNIKCGPLKFKILFYLRESKYYKELDIKITELRKFLDAYQGIRIYRDNFRVKPYGEPTGEQDWLGLNLRRAESPEAVTGRVGAWRVAENQLIGTIFITRDKNPNLEDKTDREGLFENQAFYDLKRYILHGVQFLERERQIRARALKPKKKKIDVKKDLEKSKEKLEKQADRHREEGRTDVADEIDEIAQKLTDVAEEHEELLTEHQLLFGLATLGIAMAAFGHETSAAINKIANRIEPLKTCLSASTKKSKDDFYEHLDNIEYNIGLIENWGQFALDHVRRDKRTRRFVNLNEIITNTINYFEGSFEKRKIKLVPNLNKNIPKIRAFPMDIEAIIINFITNSIDSLNHTPLEKRKVEIITDYNKTNEEYKLIFRDSGKGIKESDLGKIYDPLFSTKVDKQGKPYGTGLGLTIVKKIVEEYGGSIQAIGRGKLDGGEFIVTIPKNFKEGSI